MSECKHQSNVSGVFVTKLKRGSIVSGETVNYCLGDYRVTLLDESIDVVNKFVSR